MNSSALLFMLVTVLIIWGGLIAATISLSMRNRRDAEEKRVSAVLEVLQLENS